MIRTLTLLAWLAFCGAAFAQDDSSAFRIGDDLFSAGTAAISDEAGIDDVFLAGERVEVAAPIAGSGHLAGRRVTTSAEIGGDLYAAGGSVALAAPVGGDATLTGYDVTIGAPVARDLRAAGAHLEIEAAIGGSALLAGRSVAIEGRIEGDAVIAAEALAFGPAAEVGGRLILYVPEDVALAVPERVAAPDRVELRRVADWPEDGELEPGWGALVGSFFIGVLILALLATLAAVLAPRALERMRAETAARPFRTLWFGFLALSTLIGAAVVAALTVIGLLVAPIVLILAGLAGLIGYVLGTYLLGLGLWNAIGQLPPDSLAERALVALTGALTASLAALVPFLGWVALLAIALIGTGAFSIARLRPAFLT